ncbi:hypothetical protein EMIT091MI3_80222 [Kosakonia quasisacchari]
MPYAYPIGMTLLYIVVTTFYIQKSLQAQRNPGGTNG